VRGSAAQVGRAARPDGLDAVFRPTSIAVIGAGRSPGTVGNELLRNLVVGGFTGRVYPVNPKAESVHSIRCYPTVLDVPDDVDLAVVVVPARHVLDVARQCVEKGVRALCVITAGFREVGPEGAAEERRLRDLCRAHGVRLVGPNCMGVMDARPDVRMNATIAQAFPPPGPVAFLSQSGAMGVSILNQASDLGLGMSMFASIGNRADVSGNDLLEHWEHDEATRVVLMYLEGFGNPRRFVPIARRVSRTKPIVCVKAGRTAQAAKAATSHTGSLAGADVAVDALLEQSGVLRVETVGELFDVALALSSQPMPAGNRVAVLTNAGGPAILAVDFLVGAGIEVARLAPETTAALRKVLVPEASVANPVDMVAGAGEAEYANALPLLLADPGVDLVITIFVPPVQVDPVAVARRIFEISRGASKPVLGCFMARERVIAAIKELGHAWFPVYAYPELAVRAAKNLVRAKALREDDLGVPEPFPDVDPARIEEVLRRAGQGAPPEGTWVSAADGFALLEAAGLSVPRLTAARDVAEAVAAARAIGGPVALKLDGPAFLHKSDVGGVLLGLEGDAAVREGAERLEENAERHAPGAPRRLLVQEMVRPGVELVFGSKEDPVFGPVVMAGLGGIHVEVLRDVAFGLVPLTRTLAARMLRRLRGFRLLEGARGAPPVDLVAVETALLRFASLVEHHPSILEIEVNPATARPDGLTCVDVRARIRRTEPEQIRLIPRASV
jgi:acetyl coenzyme A synthetase (ADP forming)-like protein